MVDPTTRRFDVDPFRGWVCLSILVMHFYFHSLSHDIDALGSETVSWTIGHLRFGYESFFVLTGFFLAHSFRKPSSGFLSTPLYVKRRLIRLLIPYWVALWLVYIVRLIGNEFFDIRKPPPPMSEMFVQMAGVQNWFGVKSINIVFWSMAVVIQTYLIWTFLFWFIRRCLVGASAERSHERTEQLLDAFMVLLSLCAASNLLLEGPVSWAISFDAIFITLGVLAYRVSVYPEQRGKMVATSLVGLLVAILLDHSHMYAALVTTVILVWIGRGGRFPNWAFTRFLAFIGKRSYSIYLTHSMIGARFLELPKQWMLGGIGWDVLFFVAACLGAVLFGLTFYHFVERPFLEVSRQVRYRG